MQAKEKELLHLQRTDPSLLAPDFEQVDEVLDAINSLQLSTPDGIFVLASTADDYDNYSSYIPACSIDFYAIKNLPPSVWLAPSRSVTQQHEQRSSMFNHLLSLPIKAYLASSYKTQNQFSNHIPVVNHLLFMPIDAFKAPANKSLPVSTEIVSSTTGTTIKSLLRTEMKFSREFWVRNGHNTSYN